MTVTISTWRKALAIEALRGVRDALVIYPLVVGVLYAVHVLWLAMTQTAPPASIQLQHLFSNSAVYSLPVFLLRAKPSRNIIARLLLMLAAVVVFAVWRVCVEPGLWPIALGGIAVVALVGFGLVCRWKQEFALETPAGRFDPPLLR
ncbi:MAG: hypothetical protein Q8L55_00660 [Phycisphaerales bacterium]|nr:hypothetical protein [Phycisphaerales bacterium]